MMVWLLVAQLLVVLLGILGSWDRSTSTSFLAIPALVAGYLLASDYAIKAS